MIFRSRRGIRPSGYWAYLLFASLLIGMVWGLVSWPVAAAPAQQAVTVVPATVIVVATSPPQPVGPTPPPPPPAPNPGGSGDPPANPDATTPPAGATETLTPLPCADRYD